jgi:hypothetical protein
LAKIPFRGCFALESKKNSLGLLRLLFPEKRQRRFIETFVDKFRPADERERPSLKMEKRMQK